MEVGVGTHRYRWIENWGSFPQEIGWSHHGLAISETGNIVMGHATEPQIQILDPSGKLLNSFSVPVVETHGITLAQDVNGGEVLWLADVGQKIIPASDYVQLEEKEGKVLKMTLEGEILSVIDQSMVPGYSNKNKFRPTCVAVNPDSGDVWITDGYGQFKIHRFSKDLHHLAILDGTEGAGRFKTPHWIFWDTRKERPELYVADRYQHRIQVYDEEGKFLRSFGEGDLNAPSIFSVDGDLMIIAELRSRIAIYDLKDELLGFMM